MTDNAYDLERALSAIEDSDLRYPQNRILERYLELSTDPDASARYLFQERKRGAGIPDLKPFLTNWNELVSFCESYSLSCSL